MPSEEELARLAGLVPGDIDRKHLEELQRNLDEKGFMVTTAEDLAETIWWIATLPPHLNINAIELMPVSQSFAGFTVNREG